jgi:RHS repeat-associated protein
MSDSNRAARLIVRPHESAWGRAVARALLAASATLLAPPPVARAVPVDVPVHAASVAPGASAAASAEPRSHVGPVRPGPAGTTVGSSWLTASAQALGVLVAARVAGEGDDPASLGTARVNTVAAPALPPPTAATAAAAAAAALADDVGEPDTSGAQVLAGSAVGPDTAAARRVLSLSRPDPSTDPRLRGLRPAELPWLGASTHGLLAALAAVPGAGDAPDLVRTQTLPAGWSLVSVPLVAGNTQATSVFSSLPTPLYLYDYVGGQTLGVGEPGFRNVVPGRVFWLLLKQPQTVSISGPAINPNVEARLPLVQGWNLIATPWLSSVTWSDARVSVKSGAETVPLSEAVTRGWTDGVLYQYNPVTAAFVSFPAGGTPTGELRLWEGSAVFLNVAGELVLAAPPPDTQPPTVSLSPPPVDGQVITAPTDIVGTVDDPNLAEWRLELAPTGTTTFTTFAQGGAPVTGAVLGTLDPTLLLNGQYQVRLVATDVFGQTSTLAWTVVVKGDMKVGNFTISFVDLEVPLAGVPIQITRTYDSRDKGRGDFGIGWRLELSNIRIGENAQAGANWMGTRSAGAFPTYCLQEARPHRVTLTLPDGQVLEFRPTLQPQCQQLVPPSQVTLGFAALPGTQGTLVPLDADLALVAGSWPSSSSQTTPMDLVDFSTGDRIDPNLYRLTLPDGRAFVVSQQGGLQSITDLNGNQLVVGPGGITHNSGTGVTFTRDGLGRITRITDPAGNPMTYAYDAAGDLVTYSDRESNATTFTYDTAHTLLTIVDPLGRQPIRNDYDASGRLIRHTDAFGKTIEYTHDLAGRQEIVTDRLGGARLLVYDDRGNVIQETDPEGHVTARTFDARGNRLSETDPNGHTTSWTYDAADNVLSTTDPLGNVTAFTYNARRQVLTSTDPLGRVTTNTYDPRGNLLTITDAAGSVTSHTYDARGNLLSRTVSVGGVAQTTSLEYDARGNLTRETDALGHASTYTYDANGNRLTQAATRTLPGGGSETLVTRFEYDLASRLTRTIDPDLGFTRTVYDALGRQVESYDRLARKTTFEYDVMGRLVKTTQPDGSFDTASYDAEGRRLTSTDRGGRVTAFAYDALGRLLRRTSADGAFTANTYDAAGRLTAVTDARGNATTYAYDAAGRRIKVTDALGQETLFAYDAAGNQTSLTDPRGHTTAYQYDVLGRRTRTVMPDGTFMQTAYDALGRRVSETDQAGRQTQFQYDALGRLTGVVDALGQTTAYGYDEVGNRTSQTDANGHTTRFEHDALGREARRVLPDGAFETRSYDAAGNLASRTDFLGRTTSYAYDLDNRLTTRTYPDASVVSFSYTPTGRRLTATDARGTTRYAYDVRDRLTSLTYPDGRRLGYAYDAQGNRTGLSAVIGATTLTVGYAYDALNRPRTVADPLGRLATLSYDASGNRAGLAYVNGVATSYSYDALNRLVSLATTHVPTTTPVQSYAFTLGPAGNRTRIDEAGGTSRSYSYDDLYRLTGETIAGSPLDYAKTFTYDAVGNRLMQATTGSGAPGTPTAPGTIGSTYDVRDRLLADTGARALSYAWDANGNLTAKSGEATYAWDFDDRLIRVEKTDGTVVTHAYDVDGNRVQTTTALPGQAPVTVDYLVDTSGALSHVVAETIGGGSATLQTLYVRADDELLALMRPDPGAPTGWQSRWYHADGIGSVRALTDETGAVTDTYAYTAFGEPLTHTGTDPQPYAFTGEPYDANVGFQYHRARWLDPSTGWFVTVDPLSGLDHDPPSLHRYLYAAADPINRKDPTGEFTLPQVVVAAAIIGALAGAIGYTLTHPPGARPDQETRFTWRGFVLWTASGAALGAVAALGGWYAVVYFGPPLTTTIGGVTYTLSRTLAQQWPNLRVLADHFSRHGRQVAGVLRQGAYSLEQYAADAAYIRDFPMDKAYNAARGAWYYVRFLGNSPSGNAIFGLVIEKGGKIVSFFAVRAAEIGQYIPGIVR